MTTDHHVVRLRNLALFFDVRNGTCSLLPRSLVPGKAPRVVTMLAEEFEEHLLLLLTTIPADEDER